MLNKMAAMFPAETKRDDGLLGCEKRFDEMVDLRCVYGKVVSAMRLNEIF